MASLLESLYDNLSAQSKLVSALLETAVSKKQAIIKNDTAKLRSVTKEENELVGKSVHLGKDREKILHDIAYVLNVKKNTVTLMELINIINSPRDKERLIGLHKELISLLNNLKDLNDLNENLIKYSLEYIDYSMNVLRGFVNPEPTYFDSSGNEINSASRMFFDTTQ